MNVKKLAGLACVALVAAFAAPTFAADTYVVSLDGWFVDFNNFQRVIAQDETNCSPNCLSRSMNMDDADAVAPRFTFVWLRNSDWGFMFRWYDVSETSDRVDYFSFDSLYGQYQNGYNEYSDHGDYYGGHIEADFTAADLRVVKILKHDNAQTWWSVNFGLAYGSQERVDTVFTHNRHEWPTRNSRPDYAYVVTTEFSGVGPGLGISGSQRLGGDASRFAVFADLDAAYLQGGGDWQYNERDYVGSYSHISQSGESDRTVLRAEADFGFSYNFRLGRRKTERLDLPVHGEYIHIQQKDPNHALQLLVGYRISHWSNLPDAVPSPFEWLSFTETDRDASLSGPFISVSWVWRKYTRVVQRVD